jgi:PKD repeat protein
MIRFLGAGLLALMLFSTGSWDSAYDATAQNLPTPLPYNPWSFNPGDTIRIAITSPQYGATISGNVSILGSALHPQFFQYQILYAPDPNPQGVWYPTGILSQFPVNDGVLGNWNTAFVPNGTYQLRLTVNLRDNSALTTQVGSIRLQNQSIPVSTPTPTYLRPVAAFTPSIMAGNAPLTVQFTNQSYGNIASYQWDFGDGTGSTVPNPVHTYGTVGIYAVTLLVSGPGGQDTRQLFIQAMQASLPAPTPVIITATPALALPVAAFTTNLTYGNAPLTIQFTNQSYGNITSYQWDFGDGTTSTEANPSHIYNAVGLYPATLTVTGPGGQDMRQIFIQVFQPPAPTATPIPPPETPLIQQAIVQVSSSTDDVNETSDEYQEKASSIWIGNAGTTKAVNFAGLRFNQVPISPGTTILSARIEFYNPSLQWIELGLNIYADASGNSPTFSGDNRPSQRTPGAQAVQLESNEQSPEKSWIDYGDIAAVIQEIVNRRDWQTGNSLSIIIQGRSAGSWGRKFFTSFDGDPAHAPRLVITYQTP